MYKVYLRNLCVRIIFSRAKHAYVRIQNVVVLVIKTGLMKDCPVDEVSVASHFRHLPKRLVAYAGVLVSRRARL